MPKISWLDSTKNESRIHITKDGIRTLCGYTANSCFLGEIWIPYRVSKKRGTCSECIKLAKEQGVDIKTWHNSIPERDITALPASSQRKQDVVIWWNNFKKKNDL